MKKNPTQFIFVILSIILYSCSVHNKQSKVIGIVTRQLDFSFNFNGTVIRNNDTIVDCIYYRKDQKIVKVSYIISHIENMDSYTHCHYYLIFKSNQKYGYKYDSSLKIYGQKILLDSALKNVFALEKDYAIDFNKYAAFYNEIPFAYNKDSSYLVRQFNYFHGAKAVGDDTMSTGKIFLCYNKELLNFKPSISKTMDTIPKMKLFKIYIKNDPIYYKEKDKYFIPPNGLFQINEMKIINKKEVLPLFLKHEND